MIRRLKGLSLLIVAVAGMAACGVFCFSSTSITGDLLIGVGLLCIAVVFIDNGLGLIISNEEEVSFKVVNERRASQTLLVLIGGYNCDGPVVLDMLSGVLIDNDAAGMVMKRACRRYRIDEVVKAYYERISALKPSRIVFYVESMGGAVFAELMSRYPDLYGESVIFNAALSCNEDVVPSRMGFRLLGKFAGGPLSTMIFRWRIRATISRWALPDEESDPEIVARYAAGVSTITAPLAFDQIRFISRAGSVLAGSLADRVDRAVYLRAPEPEDRLVRTVQAQASWRRALGYSTPVTDVPIDEWHGRLHVPITRTAAVVYAIGAATSGS